MIAVADINTVWRLKPFEALSRNRPVVGLSPRRWFGSDPAVLAEADPALAVSRLSLPPGWASRWAGFSARRLLDRLRRLGTTHLFLTTPHYLPLARLADAEMTLYYYGSDDYSQYRGWGGQGVLEEEFELASRCRRAFFVSKRLADRAVAAGLNPDRVQVCPNATEPGAFRNPGEEHRRVVDRVLASLPRPLVGVVGSINERLDFELLLACAELPEVGSLLLVGPVSAETAPSLTRLRVHPKCHFAGERPHPEIPAWAAALDVALIPYADSPLNRACSPMRLFDHLAAGRPIVSTSACEQVGEYEGHLRRGRKAHEVLEKIRQQIQEPRFPAASPEFLAGISWEARAATLSLSL